MINFRMMKKQLLIGFGLLLIGSLNAQEIGIRFGGANGGGGVALDGVFGAGPGRIHADLGFYDALAADVVWDLIYKPLGEEAFYWYLGPGVSTWIGDDFWLGVCGELGLEYRFNTVPIAIGADWRPTFWLIENTRFGANSFGLNVRWNFGE